MKAVPSIKCNCIQDWKSDLEQLKRVRYIRNNLAHAEDSFNIEECTQKDIDFVTGFYNRILNQTDPLSLLHQSYSEKNHISNKVYAQKRQVEVQANMQTEKPVNNNIYNQTNEDMEKSVINIIFAVFAIIIIVTLITLFIML